MKNALLTLALTTAVLVGGMAWTDTAQAYPRGWRYYGGPARYYGGYYGSYYPRYYSSYDYPRYYSGYYAPGYYNYAPGYYSYPYRYSYRPGLYVAPRAGVYLRY